MLEVEVVGVDAVAGEGLGGALVLGGVAGEDGVLGVGTDGIVGAGGEMWGCGACR